MRRAITARSITSIAPYRIGYPLVENLPTHQKCSTPSFLRTTTNPVHDQVCKRQISPLSIWSLVSPASSTTNYNTNNDSNNTTKNRQNANDSQFQQSPKSTMSMPTRQQQVPRPGDCDREIARLLDCPNDAILDAATWVKADSCVLEAVEKGNFNLAFELMDRMAKDPKAPTEMNNEVLFTVVHEWLMAYTQFLKTPAKEKPSTYLHSPLSVWRRIERYLESGIPIESRTIHRILDSTAVVKSKKLNGPALAETILQRMMELSKRQNPDIRPSAYTFNAVIAAWEAAATVSSPTSKLALQEAPERAMMLLERLKALHAAKWGEEFMPDRHTYRRVMNLYAHRGEADQVEALMEELYALYQQYGYTTLLPTTHMFSIVLYAWSKSHDPEASERANTLLQHMLQMEKDQVIPSFRVTSFCFNIVMLCWSKQRSGESAQKAQDVFDQMVQLSEKDPSKRPIPGSYATLIYTWSFHDPKKAEEALWAWRAESNAGTCPMRMDNKVFTAILSGWFHSKDPEAAMRCDRLLKYALDGQFGDSWWPQAIDFNMTINAYCRRNNPKEIERAEALLEEMTHEKHTSRGFPGATSPAYVSVIHALARAGKPDRADKWLHQWFDHRDRAPTDVDYPSSSTDSAEGFKKKQSTRTFNRVLKAWLSKALVIPEASFRAEELMLKMEGWGVKFNVGSFQYVLECRKKNQKEYGVVDKLGQVDRANRIVALLDRAYASNALNIDKSNFLALRREWALEAL